MEELLTTHPMENLKDGSIVKGIVTKIGNNEVVVDIGGKSEGSIPAIEFNDVESIEVGSEVDVYIDKLEDKFGNPVLSHDKALQKKNWELIVENCEEGSILPGRVKGKIKGGLLVNIGVDAFLPASQVDTQSPINLDQYIGNTYEFKIVKINQERKNIILSRRELIEEERQEKRKVLLDEIKVGDIRTGIVKNIADYGSAVYIIGSNANLFSSNFTNHNVKNGSVYIKGINAYVYDSIFEKNLGESGAGLYVEGLNTTLILSNFSNNNVTAKGGAIYINGSNAQLILSNFLNNNAIPNILDVDSGLGGAVYIKGDNNAIDSSIFNYNTARNGSAIYTDGLNMSLSNTNFDRNQAWSYILASSVNPSLSYFNESDILIDLTLIGGNNIANAIYNTASMDEIYFYNVSYVSSKGPKYTGLEELHPVDGAENSNDGSLLYQDDREDNQLVNVVIYKDSQDNGEGIYGLSSNAIGDESISNNDIILNKTFITGILGDISFNLSDYIDGPLEKGKYILYAKHFEDDYYKEIDGNNKFASYFSLKVI